MNWRYDGSEFALNVGVDIVTGDKTMKTTDGK